MGRHFWVGCGCFSLGGGGRKRKCQGMFSRVGRWTTRKQSRFVIYYMLNSGGLSFQHVLRSSRRGSSILDVLDSARVLFKLRQPVDLFHTLKTVKGLLHLVPPRTPRNSRRVIFGKQNWRCA
jgi:hypothetical protein